jgi:hypothetical protein
MMTSLLTFPQDETSFHDPMHRDGRSALRAGLLSQLCQLRIGKGRAQLGGRHIARRDSRHLFRTQWFQQLARSAPPLDVRQLTHAPILDIAFRSSTLRTFSN